MRHDTCVGAWRKRWSDFDQNRAVSLPGVSSLDVSFVRCEEEVSYCQNLTKVMENVGKVEIPTMVNRAWWFLERPYKNFELILRRSATQLRVGVGGTTKHRCTKRIDNRLA